MHDMTHLSNSNPNFSLLQTFSKLAPLQHCFTFCQVGDFRVQTNYYYFSLLLYFDYFKIIMPNALSCNINNSMISP